MINEYRNNDYYQRYAQISSLSKNNSHFIDEFSIKMKQDIEVSRFSRKSRFFEKLDDVVIFFRYDSTFFESSFFLIINSVFRHQTRVSQKSASSTFDSTFSTFDSVFRRVINVTSTKKVIHHAFIESRLSTNRRSNFESQSAIDIIIISKQLQRLIDTIIDSYVTRHSIELDFFDSSDFSEFQETHEANDMNDNNVNVDNK